MSKHIDWSVRAKRIVCDPYDLEKHQVRYDHEVTDEMIDEAYLIAARLVRDRGSKYLPIFERMQQEKEHRMKSRDLMQQALEVAIN